MTANPRSELVHNWWSKAGESFASAKRELRAESFTFADNRIYYAAFYGVTAALLDHNLSFKKHAGTRKAFHREFIKTGKLDKHWGSFYDQLFEDRHEGDYVSGVNFDKDYVESQLESCEAFLTALRSQISKLSEQ